MALIYGGIVFVVSAMLAVLLVHVSNNPKMEAAYSLAFVPVIVIVWFSYLGWLPFTRSSVLINQADEVTALRLTK